MNGSTAASLAPPAHPVRELLADLACAAALGAGLGLIVLAFNVGVVLRALGGRR